MAMIAILLLGPIGPASATSGNPAQAQPCFGGVSLTGGMSQVSFRIPDQHGVYKPQLFSPAPFNQDITPTTGFCLSDSVLRGSFAMNFVITTVGTPAVQSFWVTNPGPSAMTLTYISETKKSLFHGPTPDASKLEVCFNPLCDAGIWVPDTQFTPAPGGSPLVTVPAGGSRKLTVKIRLAPGTDAGPWRGGSINTQLAFRKDA